MRALVNRLLALLLAPALVLLAAPALPQTALPGDPPARVGRLSHVEGQVSSRTADQNDWSAAVLNYPVSTGLSLWTEPGARAEISYGDGALRLDHETAIAVERLDDNAVDLRLDQGSVQLSVRVLGPRERVSITTPQGRMEALSPGTYRIDAGTGETPAGVTVLDGKARFSDGGRSVEAVGGESAIVKQDGSLGTVAAIRQPFDEWALAREADVKAATVTPRHVPRAMPGYEDLDRHGTWQDTPSYGAVWYPAAVPAYWAPYRYGHWAWVPPWGWTWIDDAPWGFAPFHYGRWVHYHGRWGWMPGYYARARPVYAPALVAFIGGSNFSIGISIGRAPAIGWVPLGPREVYYPYYRSSVTYVRNVNVVHVEKTVINNINVTNIKSGPPQRSVEAFGNRRAATVVPVDAMRRAEPVHRVAQRDFDRADLQGARPTTNLAALQPSRAARAGFQTEPAATSRGPDRGDDRPAPRQASPGRPVTSDPDKLPAAPGPRREARATPERGGQERPSLDRSAPDRAGPDRAAPDRAAPSRAAPAPSPGARVAPQPEPSTPRAQPDRGGVDRDGRERGGERVQPAPRAAPAPGPSGPQTREQGPRDQAPRQAQPPQAPPQQAQPPQAQPRQAQPRDVQPREAQPRDVQPREAPRREPQGREPPGRDQDQRSEAPARPPMPTVHGPGRDQGVTREPSQAREPSAARTPPVARIEPTRPAPPESVNRPRVEQPRNEPPRAARIEPPRTEQPRLQQPRVEQPRVEQPRVERPRMESPRPEPQRAEPPRVERRVEQARPAPPPQPQRQPERREAPRQGCPPNADCTR
jgi:hypothetical protein